MCVAANASFRLDTLGIGWQFPEITLTHKSMHKSTKLYIPHQNKVAENGCISIVGMAASGKTTVGAELSNLIGWEQVDTDNLIEASFGMPLHSLSTCISKDEFLDVESAVIQRMSGKRLIVSTGGSVVYRPQTIAYLKTLGPIVYIAVPLPIILERIARKPDRGLAIAPGQTIEDLYNERRKLYEAAASFTVHGGFEPASVYAETVARWLGSPL